MATAIRHLGTCPVCQGEFKARTGTDHAGFQGVVLVHHGYQRPGHGSIVGDCFGVGYRPYEVSPQGCRDYQALCQNTLRNRHEYLERLSKRVPTVMVEHDYPLYILLGSPEPHEKTSRDFRSGKLAVLGDRKWHRNDPDEVYAYDRLREAKMREVQYEVRQLESEIERMTKLIADWTEKPVKEWSEEIEAAMKKAERDARAKVVEEKRQAKAAEETRKKAKRDALEARYQAIRDDFATKFRALAASPEKLEDRQKEARTLAFEMKKAKYRSAIGWTKELNCDDALITLGLAKREGDWVRYEYPL